VVVRVLLMLAIEGRGGVSSCFLSEVPLIYFGHVFDAEAECNWYLRDISIFIL
jgi:hypothetical protein